ncbi:hypothetical protein KP509_20G069200 [Ceratopteris richardii]|uniref:Reverse transcriptase domain-containing protein n=1 Tax=Ceratopteris richardii TaxID=49495 RepID=A0A8T2SJJ5_CERRI|nr:hypothetical protein KP509_20G069200 [Ceratopteris richardii]
MLDVIRDCGKYFSRVVNTARVEAEYVILSLTEKVDMGHLLPQREYSRLCDAYRCLHYAENNAIHSAKARARCMDVNDLHATSRCFFDFLRAKRAANNISSLEIGDKEQREGNSIADACSDHYRNLFAASYSSDDSWFAALHEDLTHTPQCLDSRTVASCETSITEEEIFLALGSLKNGKAPGLDGLSKEFVLTFWPSLKALLLDVCNEIWMDQKMPYSFKQGKIKLLPKDSISQVEIYGRLSAPFSVQRSVRQGCPLSPLFYAMALTPMSSLLQAKMESGFIHGISLHGNQHIVVGFEDDTFIFAKACEENIQHILASLIPFSEARGRTNVWTKDQIQWVLCRIKSKLNLWHAAQWPLHINIRIVQSDLQPYIMYYMLLLDWKKCHLYAFKCLIKNFLWNKEHNRALALSSWDFICQPKSKGSLGILQLQSHMMARRETFIMGITSVFKPLWTDAFWKIMDNAKVYYKGTSKMNAWNKFLSHAPL